MEVRTAEVYRPEGVSFLSLHLFPPPFSLFFLLFFSDKPSVKEWKRMERGDPARPLVCYTSSVSSPPFLSPFSPQREELRGETVDKSDLSRLPLSSSLFLPFFFRWDSKR